MTKIKLGSRIEQPDPTKFANPAPESESHSKFGRTVSQAHAQTPMPDMPTNPSALNPVGERDVSTLTETEPSPQKDPAVKPGDVFKQCGGAARLYYKNNPRSRPPRWQGESGRYHVAYARVYEKHNDANIKEALKKVNDEALKKENKGLENKDEKLEDNHEKLKNKHEKLKNNHENLKSKVLPDEYKLIKSRLNLEKKNDGYHLNPKGISSTVQIIEHISNISCCLVLLGKEEEALNYINAGYRYFEGEVVPALQDAEYDLTRKL